MTDKPRDATKDLAREQADYFPEGGDPTDVRSANYWILQSNEAWKAAADYMTKGDEARAERDALRSALQEARAKALEEAANEAGDYLRHVNQPIFAGRVREVIRALAATKAEGES